MTFIESFQKELDREAVTTRKMLDIVPAEHYDWKPHEKSMSLRQLASHVAEIPGWLDGVLNTPGIDFATDYKATVINGSSDLMHFFEISLASGKKALANANDDQLKDTWTMRYADKLLASEPKDEVLRHCFCQVVHHRAQLGVYLRILNVPIPGSYGPSADEQSMM